MGELVLNIIQYNVLEMPVHGKKQLSVPEVSDIVSEIE